MVARDGGTTRTRFGRVLGVAALMLVLGPILGALILLGSQLVPDDVIVDKLVRAHETGALDENSYHTSGFGDLIDRFTECAALTVGVDERDGYGALNSAVRNYVPTSGCSGMYSTLIALRADQQPTGGTEIYRYWFGSAAIVRPVLAVSDMPTTRAVVAILLYLPTVLLFSCATRVFGWWPTIMLLGPLVVATDFVVLPESIPQALAIASAIFSLLLSLRYVSSNPDLSSTLFASLASGMVVAFFDLLVAAPVSISLTAAVLAAVLYCERGTSMRTSLSGGLVSAFAWAFGYGWMWASKWLITMPYEGARTVLANVRGAAAWRMNGAEGTVDRTFGAPIERSIEYFLDRPLGPLAVVVVLVSGGVALGKEGRYRVAAARMCGIALIPTVCALVWYTVFSNHTQVHVWFMYRAVAALLGIVGFAAVVQTPMSNSRIRLTRPTSGTGVEPTGIPAPPDQASLVKRLKVDSEPI